MSPELRERLIALLESIDLHWKHSYGHEWFLVCSSCEAHEHTPHKPDCELQACLQELRALPQTEHPSINDGVLAIYGFKPVP